MKFKFKGVVTSLLISASHFSTFTYAAEVEEDGSYGLSKAFIERSLKAASVAGYSAQNTNMNWLPREYFKNPIPNAYEDKWKGIDDAALVEDDGQCFVAFQSTQWEEDRTDMGQNLNPRSAKLCNEGGQCCKFREGFVNGWNNTSWNSQLTEDVKACVGRCTKDPCLIITGHSQGGSIATVASLHLADVTSSYEVITFAAAPALVWTPETCSPQMNFNAHYRFGKALFKDEWSGGRAGLVFDKVSFLGPDPIPGFATYSVGEFLIVSNEDFDNVAHVGMNTELTLHPWDHHPPPLGHAHYLSDETHLGYWEILEKMFNKTEENSFPIGVRGLKNEMHCGRTEYGPILCESDRCDQVNGEKHQCLPKLNNGELCRNDNDCLSGRCPSTFPSKCMDKAGNGEPCATNKDCIDGYFCPAGISRKCKAKKEKNEEL